MAAIDEEEEAILRELELEDDDFSSKFRENRAKELKTSIDSYKEMKLNKFGVLSEPDNEGELIKLTSKSKYALISFYHEEFRRCHIMNGHLEELAKKYFNTKFMKFQVKNAPFLVEKLKIQVLPCVVMFIDGQTVDKIIGFEELGETDNFKIDVLEKRLIKSNAIQDDTIKDGNRPNTIFGFADTKRNDESDEDDF
ncbi:hypothetical protein HK099_001460 [Clydaea vesicula]|uniref:Thioredoxin domain-containing protein n=1 Tax=Clydaea vesicula TaxID=447962 RepID=A0AAD5TU24_9FUNG|nr:hypothetical protein HK099_001460 [Clydaea vesicula]KAJ3390875.1 hypothetical protein HDU92_000235 [Lobulomyces angularis]